MTITVSIQILAEGKENQVDSRRPLVKSHKDSSQ